MAGAEVSGPVVSVVKVPCLVWVDELSASSAPDSSGRDARCPLSAECVVLRPVAALLTGAASVFVFALVRVAASWFVE